MSVTIRRAKPEDLPELQRLNRALFDYEHERGFYQDESYRLNWAYEDAGRAAIEGCLGDIQDKVALIAESGGHAVGYLIGSYTSKSYRTQNPIAELDNIFIEPSSRRSGVGARLFEAFKEWARSSGVKRLKVATFVGNHEAQNFYRKNGFKESEVVLEQPLD